MVGKTIGIVGGGQLGRMLTSAAESLGFKVIVLDPAPDCPASQVGAEQIVGGLYDKQKLQELVSRSDFVTYEIEHLGAEFLSGLAGSERINPSPRVIKLIQDKFQQKVFWQKNNLPVGEFEEINSIAEAQKVLKNYGGKMVIKAKHQSFDGRGNALVRSEAELKDAFANFKDRELYAEKFIEFSREIAVVVVRSTSASIKAYPVFETKHERNICTEVVAPARVSEDVKKKAISIATKVANKLDSAGLFTVEMFVTKTGDVLINEVAPRVHNSGHLTIEACKTSQFEQCIRAISGIDLGETDMKVPAAAMVNILGERNGQVMLGGVEEANEVDGVYVHLYGKSPTRIDRKMGHITAVADNVELALDNALKARGMISI